MVDVSLTVYHHWAMQLAGAMKLCQDDLPAYASATALLAVHSAIAYSDAVLIGLGDKRPRSENHMEAVKALRRACAGARLDHQGIAHLQKLLSAKTDVSYGDKRVDDEKVTALCVAAERFQVWAERILSPRKERQSS
jgi:hypothetical protein